jgi:hypothetical protein
MLLLEFLQFHFISVMNMVCPLGKKYLHNV